MEIDMAPHWPRVRFWQGTIMYHRILSWLKETPLPYAVPIQGCFIMPLMVLLLWRSSQQLSCARPRLYAVLFQAPVSGCRA